MSILFVPPNRFLNSRYPSEDRQPKSLSNPCWSLKNHRLENVQQKQNRPLSVQPRKQHQRPSPLKSVQPQNQLPPPSQRQSPKQSERRLLSLSQRFRLQKSGLLPRLSLLLLLLSVPLVSRPAMAQQSRSLR